MSTETFLRLPKEKQKRFLDAAWEEFTSVPFEKASINKIVMRAQIPRGSFYQYFTDKKALFQYLLSGMMEYFLQEYRKMLEQEGGDIFQTQMACFDRVVLKKETHPLFLKGMEIFQANLMYLSQAIVESRVGYSIWDATKECVDLSWFRGEDERIAKQAFVMSLMMLVLAMADAMKRPAQVEVCRQELLFQLEILRDGSAENRGIKGV